MKKIRLYDFEGNILFPSTDVDIVENCPMSKKDDSVVFGLSSSNLEINSKGIRMDGKNIDIGGRKKTSINGNVYLKDSTTGNKMVRLKDYPVSENKSPEYFGQLLGVVVPLTQPTEEYYVYPGFVLKPNSGSSHSEDQCFYFKVNNNNMVSLFEMDPNTQKFVPLGSKTLY